MPADRPIRVTKRGQEARILIVYKLVAEGHTYATIVRCCMEEFGVSARQAARYIAAARDQFAQQAAQNRDALAGVALERLSMLFNLSTHYSNNLPLALDVMREFNQVMLNIKPAAPPDARLRRAIARVSTVPRRRVSEPRRWTPTPEEVESPSLSVSLWDLDNGVFKRDDDPS